MTSPTAQERAAEVLNQIYHPGKVAMWPEDVLKLRTDLIATALDAHADARLEEAAKLAGDFPVSTEFYHEKCGQKGSVFTNIPKICEAIRRLKSGKNGAPK